jgi:hypothetical protein
MSKYMCNITSFVLGFKMNNMNSNCFLIYGERERGRGREGEGESERERIITY